MKSLKMKIKLTIEQVDKLKKLLTLTRIKIENTNILLITKTEMFSTFLRLRGCVLYVINKIL